MTMIGPILLAAAAAAPAPVPAPVPTTPDGWRALARTDVTAVHDILREDHPAVYVRRDGAPFRDWLERGYREALDRLPKVTDVNSYFFLVRRYVNGFRDAHILVFPIAGFPAKAFVSSWPGFTTRWYKGRYVVSYVDPAQVAPAPPVGATLIGCDGQAAERLAQDRLDLYEGNLRLPLQRATTAGALLRDRRNPFVGPPPSRCTFAFAGRA